MPSALANIYCFVYLHEMVIKLSFFLAVKIYSNTLMITDYTGKEAPGHKVIIKQSLSFSKHLKGPKALFLPFTFKMGKVRLSTFYLRNNLCPTEIHTKSLLQPTKILHFEVFASTRRTKVLLTLLYEF